ncbi:MAG: 16S rRNA (uracil(1498)-N(3))-methyltransferase [Vulcanimicrobiaceae bacterium]
MSRPRFFIEGRHESGDVVGLAGDDTHKIVDVLRMHAGDGMVIVDSAARTYAASLVLDGARASARLDELLPGAAEARMRITLAQAIPKGQKLDFVIEKATELGVARLIPLQTSRTIGGASEHKLERWRKLARSAAQQSGRSTVPEIEPPQEFTALLLRIAQFDAAIFAWEIATQPLRDALRDLPAAENVLAIVGPEGGFSHAEAEAAIEAGAHAVSLGSRILRTETAPLVILTALLYESGEL